MSVRVGDMFKTREGKIYEAARTFGPCVEAWEQESGDFHLISLDEIVSTWPRS